jgi:hypothetical protein
MVDTHGSAYWGSTALMRALGHLPAANGVSRARFALGSITAPTTNIAGLSIPIPIIHTLP